MEEATLDVDGTGQMECALVGRGSQGRAGDRVGWMECALVGRGLQGRAGDTKNYLVPNVYSINRRESWGQIRPRCVGKSWLSAESRPWGTLG